jgi:kinetochore protein Spc25
MKAHPPPAVLQSERHTVTELQSSLTHLQQTLAKTRDQSAALEAELAAVRKEVKAQRSEKDRQEGKLVEMRNRDAVDLSELEDVIGWKVEGVQRECCVQLSCFGVPGLMGETPR